ncbi:MAG TPA: 3-hydroxybutyrate oligomer hydrolase family protein [Stellaceae bacterium]|nr:3-hydroxybutyrate oligomer hydrolase family protein [Stellaceae bacterium]
MNARFTMNARLTAAVLAMTISLSAGHAADAPPAWLRLGPHTVYDGRTDDLVTGGLGAAGMLQGPPGFADSEHPTAPELRRASLYTRGSAGQGFGRLFGPDVDSRTGQKLLDEARVAGEEYLAYDVGDGGVKRAALLLQLPANLSADRRCIVATPVSGSASLYRDVVDFGFWGLRHGCAVVYTDKGHGNGFHILETDQVETLDGRMVPAAQAGDDAHFRADMDAVARQRFLADWPHRIAFKAAHSKRNPETEWGDDVLRAVRFAFWQMAQRDPGFTRANTLVIVTGSSNGGGAALYAGEHDADHLVDGIVAREPQVQLRPDDRVSVTRGSVTRTGSGRTLLDYFTFGNLYQPCAVLAVPGIPLRERIDFAANRCASLRAKGLLNADDTDGQAREALDRMHAYGWDAETDIGHAFGYFVAPDATATKYINDHGRFDVQDRICGYSYAAVDAEGRPVSLRLDEQARNFAIAPGGAPAGSIDVINDLDPSGPRRNWVSASPSSGVQDYNLDGALCLRDLVTGQSAAARRVQAGVTEFLATGALHGLPTLIVHGRSDDRVPVSFSSRPYLGLNALQDGERSQLRYIEVTNAEHFSTDLPGFDTRMLPLTYYHLQALDLMWAHLTAQVPLPGSQVIRTIPRGGEPGHAPALQAGSLPQIVSQPPPLNRIDVLQGHVILPD